MGYWAVEWYYAAAPEIPRSVSRHVGADRIHRVLAYLCARADDDTAEAYPSQTTIADALGGMDRRDVRAAITALEDLRLIIPVAPSVARVRGVTYRLALSRFPDYAEDSGGVPRHIPARLGRGTPPGDDTNSGGVPPEQARESGGVSGGVPRHDQVINSPCSYSPGLVVAREDPVDSEISDEDLAAISNPRTRDVIARATGRTPDPPPRFETPPDIAALLDANPHDPAYEFRHLAPKRRRRRLGGTPP